MASAYPTDEENLFGDSIGRKYKVNMNKNDHNHAPDLHKEHLLEKRRKLKDNAAVSDEPPRKIIIKNANDAFHSDLVAHQPSYEADRQVINRTKNKLPSDYPPYPESLKDIAIPEFLMKSLSRHRAEDSSSEGGELFLLFDSGVDDPDRFFMFGTQKNISQLELGRIYADGICLMVYYSYVFFVDFNLLYFTTRYFQYRS